MLIAILLVIVIYIFACGKVETSDTDKIQYHSVNDDIPEQIESEFEDLPEEIQRTIPTRIEMPHEERQAKIAPRKLANQHSEAVKISREKALAVREGDFEGQDSSLIAEIDRIRAFRQSKEQETEER